jgi:UDP-N-acetylglucosamine:LPS N-acetylglucosamine transferase
MGKNKVLAVASRGGHWVQLLRLREAFEDCDVVYVTTDCAYQSTVQDAKFRTVIEANRNQKLRMGLLVIQLLFLILRERPAAIVTTGAAPGYLALRIGRLFGARTLWIDSIANAEQLSLSGRLATRCADVTLTQWEHLAELGGPEFHGAVL